MRYTFFCEKCETNTILNLPVSECDSHPRCAECGREMNRNFMADWVTTQVNTNSCKDHNKIPDDKRVSPLMGNQMTFSGKQAERREELFRKDIALKEEAVARGGNKGTIRMKKSVPSDLYHGKIKQTGDKNYWNDKKNLERHKEFDL